MADRRCVAIWVTLDAPHGAPWVEVESMTDLSPGIVAAAICEAYDLVVEGEYEIADGGDTDDS